MPDLAVLLTLQMAGERNTIYLVDASIYVFRAWFSLPEALISVDGQPVNAVYGFLRSVTDLLEKTRPTHIAFAFDGSLTSSFRNEIFAAYKANREPAPDELKAQFEMCRTLVSALGMTTLIDDRYEADDLIATVACARRSAGFQNVIVSSDKDLMQLVEPGDEWWNFPGNERLSVDGVHRRFGVWPNQITDYLALVGDSVDNIPGVPGVGAKSAARLLRLYPSLEDIYENLPQVSQLALRGAGRIAASLKQHSHQVFMARELATLVRGVPLTLGEYELKAPDTKRLDDLIDRLDRGGGFVERARRALRN